MLRFTLGQKWITKDGKLYGEVVEVSDEGRSGVILITDENGNTIDRYTGSAAGFIGPGRWQLAIC